MCNDGITRNKTKINKRSVDETSLEKPYINILYNIIIVYMKFAGSKFYKKTVKFI